MRGHTARPILATLALSERLRAIIDSEQTIDAYRLEMDLLPMVQEMRYRGIRWTWMPRCEAVDICWAAVTKS